MTPAAAFSLEPARAGDFESLLALRLRAMRDSLMQLGRYDEARSRERLAAGFDPALTQWIVVDGRRGGFFVLKPLSHALRLEHFYIDPALQNRGVGGAVLETVCAQADAALLPIELCALKGSPANRFYLRHGFVHVGDGPWDHDYVRVPLSAHQRTVRAMWAAFQRRDWPAARALMADDLRATWWTSGERFTSAEGFIAAQSEYPEGWTIRLLEMAPLQDGRVMTLVRVDHPPQAFYATSFFLVDDDRILAVDEYWATAEPPPAWRDALPGRRRFDALDDPRARTP